MKTISVGKSTKTFKPQNINNLHDLADIIVKTNWSCGIFNEEHRKIDNFVESQFMALDIDEGVSIEEARRRLEGLSHILAPTKSHKKEKNGKICDRFRAVVVLEEPIQDVNDYYATYGELMKLFPEADRACKDPSRFYYPSKEVYQVKKGKSYPITKYVAPEKVERDLTKKGQLSRLTLDLLMFGAEAGTRHERLVKAAADANENNYTQEEFTAMVAEMAKRTGNWTDVDLNDDDYGTINDMYSKEPRHAPREVQKSTFNFMEIGDLLKQSSKIDWLVSGLLTRGGLSLLVGAPKSGKSTLTRQLTKAVARGETFLNRKVKQGRVLVLALEEQAEVINSQYKQLGVKKTDDIMVHVGRIIGDKAVEDLEAACMDYKPALIVVDTMMLFCKTQNINDYSEMNNKLEALRDMARKTNAHVICLHHQNKSRDNYGSQTILGSAAIHGAVDSALIFSKDGARRSIQTSQRAGKPFDGEELIFDEENQTYHLGKKRNYIDEAF